MTTQEDVLNYVEEEGVKFIRLAYYDLFGVQRNVSIMPRQLKRAFSRGVSIDASHVFPCPSLKGRDLVLHPDASTMILLPWRSMENGVIHMVCDLYTTDGEPFEVDTRRFLKEVLQSTYEHDLDLLMAAKYEFYLFECDEKGNPTRIPFDQGSYMDVAPLDQGENIRREICLTLEAMELDPHKSYHQSGPGQNEIDFHFSDPLSAADDASIFKWVVRTCASANGLFADFSPKPLDDQPGSAMHVQVRFLNHPEKQDAFLAGLMKYLPDLQLFMCATPQSYKRLDHSSAPHYFNYSKEIRNVMVRIPPLSPDVMEIRLPDSISNPYLNFALILMAGMKGIDENLSLAYVDSGDPIACASSLKQAKEIARSAEWLKEELHPDLFEAYFNTEDEQ